jgi:hypothetical protein
VTVVLLGRDLLFGSRIAATAERAGASFVRVEAPIELPSAEIVDLLLVDWGDRAPGWGAALAAWNAVPTPGVRPRIVAFGPHTDLAAHADANDAGVGPMVARSRLLALLGEMLKGSRTAAGDPQLPGGRR